MNIWICLPSIIWICLPSIISYKMWILFKSLDSGWWFNVVVQSFSHVQLFVTPWTAAWEASLSFTIPLSFLQFMAIESVMPSNHLIFWHPLLLLLSIFPRIRVFSNELTLHIRWPKYWSFSFSMSPPSEYSEFMYLCFFKWYLNAWMNKWLKQWRAPGCARYTELI